MIDEMLYKINRVHVCVCVNENVFYSKLEIFEVT